MTEDVEPLQSEESDISNPPPPGIEPHARKDQIDADSPDSTSIAPSDGTGVTGNVEPPPQRDAAGDW